jgi:hypothetical protein
VNHEAIFWIGIACSALFAILLYRWARKIVIVALLCISAHSADFLTTLAQVESGNRPAAIGQHGERGAYQLTAAAWWDVTSERRRAGLRVYSFSAAHDPRISRIYAVEYLRLLTTDFTASQGRNPTSAELYALWNLGYRGFRARGFSLKQTPASTQRAAAKFQ